MPAAAPQLDLSTPHDPVRAVAVLLHGGRPDSLAPSRPWRLVAVRMRPFARALRTTPGLAVGLLEYRYRGWNGPAAHPVADACWALDHVAEQFGDVPVVLVGHSMGGRAALRAAGHPLVRGVAALAPWLPPEEPVDQLAGRTVLIAHGDRERMTDPRLSYSYAVRARAVTAVCRFDVLGDGHAMLRRPTDWHRLVRQFVRGCTGIEPFGPEIANALGAPIPDGLRAPLSRT